MKDQLTPREREVAELLRRGLTNEEIASALGITLDGAKYDVSQILSKLGVASREEAARALATPRRPSRVDTALLLRVAGASLIAAAVVGVALLGLGVLQTSGSPDTSLDNPTGILQPYVAPIDRDVLVNQDYKWPEDDTTSDKIEFPAHLSNFAGLRSTMRAPYDVAIGPDGDLWITWVGSDGTAVLAHNPADTTAVSVYGVPISVRGIDAFVEIDAKGRPVVGSGGQVAVIDPRTLEYKKISMPVAQMLVFEVEGESAFVLAWGTEGEATAVTRADLETGMVSEIAVPASFGGFDKIAVSRDRIWLLRTYDGPTGQAQIGALDRTTGKLDVVKIKIQSAGVYKDGIMALTWRDGMALIDETGAQPYHTETLDAALVNKVGPISTVHADGRGGVWVSDVTAREVVWFDPETGATEVFLLPQYTVSLFGCPIGADCSDPAIMLTQITATAVSPDSDLYFTDATRNRTGVIRAP